jgi:hypothetical protein
LIGTKHAVSQIARASLASFFWLLTNAFTCWAGISFMLNPSAAAKVQTHAKHWVKIFPESFIFIVSDLASADAVWVKGCASPIELIDKVVSCMDGRK